MKQIFTALVILAVLPGAISAQEESDTSWIDSMVDSVVHAAFNRFDEQYHTYIFTEAPSAEENTMNGAPEEGPARGRRYYSRSDHALFATPYETRLNRSAIASYPWTGYDDHFLLRYNRVEALFIGLNFPDRFTWESRSISMFGSVGYGFANHRWRYSGGISRQFGTGRSLLEIGVEGHSLTDTKDQWIVGEGENSLAAFFLRNDYRDYFSREGFSGWMGLYGRWQNTDMQLRVSYLNDQYGSLDRNTSWSVFGTERSFRENPPIADGRMRSFLTSFEIHEEHQRTYYTTGWNAALAVEVSRPALSSDFSFMRYLAEATRYQPLGRYETFNIRVRAGSGTGDLPPQKGFELGGISTLPAYSYKDFSGNRILLLNAEYVLNGELFDDVEIFPSWLLRNLNFIVFADAGHANTVTGEESFTRGFNDVSARTIKSDWGIGIGTRDAKVRLGFAWKTDVAEPVKVFLRLTRPF